MIRLRRTMFAVAIAGSIVAGGVIGAVVYNASTIAANAASTPPAAAAAAGTPRSNEDATHEKAETAAQETAEDNGTARHGGHAPLMAGADDVRPEDGTDDERRARVDDGARRRDVGHGAGAEEESVRQRRRQRADHLDRARHGHRHFERAHAAVGERVDHGAELRRILQPDHGDHSELFDPLRDRRPSQQGIGAGAVDGLHPQNSNRNPSCPSRGISRDAPIVQSPS